MLYKRWWLIAVSAANLCGAMWGFAWYGEQLASTSWWLWPLVPDSPLSALLFAVCTWRLAWSGRFGSAIWALTAWLAVLGVLKYGLWTTVGFSYYLWGAAFTPTATEWFLYLSHMGMAMEGLLYLSALPVQPRAAAVALAWLGVNDFMDYIWGTHPLLPQPQDAVLAMYAAVALTLLAGVATTVFFWRRTVFFAKRGLH